MKTFVGKEPEISIADQQWKSYGGDINMLEFKGTSFANTNVLLLQQNRDSRIREVPLNASLATLVQRLSFESRVIIDAGGNTTYTLATQLDLIRFLAKNINHFEQQLTNASVASLGLWLKRNLHPIPPTKLAIAAFYLMWTNGLPCLPIVDTNNKLLANLSITDLNSLSQENFGSLLHPVGTFITEEVRNPKLPPIRITPETSFGNCLLFFCSLWCASFVGGE
jgi:hypothetical protein